jgi:hypothetical protein
VRELFPDPKEGNTEKCKKFLNKYCHPLQIGTGIVFSIVGIGVVSAGVMYADGINFLFQNSLQLPNQISEGIDVNASANYVRESYRGSIENAINAGWKQVPFSYCIGHYVGGKFRQKISQLFGR